MKFKLNPLTGEFDYTSESANKQKLNPLTGEFNLVEGNGPFSQIFNPLTGNFNLLGNSTPPVTHTYTMLESVDVLAENIGAYLLVPYKVNYKSKIRAKYMQTADNVPGANVAASVFGVTNNTPTTNNAYNGFLRLLGGSSASGFNRVGRGDFTVGTIADCTAVEFPNSLNVWHTLYYNLNVVSQDDTGTKTLAEPTTDPTWVSERDFALFGRAQPGSGGGDTTVSMPFVGKIAYFSIEEDGVLTLNLVPAKRNSDNVVGFYDTISGNFYAATNGTFTAGAEICTLDSFYECTGDSWVQLGHQTKDNMVAKIHYSVFHSGSVYVFGARAIPSYSQGNLQLLTASGSMNGGTVTAFAGGTFVKATSDGSDWARSDGQNNEFEVDITVNNDKTYSALFKDFVHNKTATGSGTFLEYLDTDPKYLYLSGNGYTDNKERAGSMIYSLDLFYGGSNPSEAHYVPATRVSDDVHGFYEVVSHTFYAAA